ncbi:ogr/Delta-like zinc finger family protein [Cupriavidus pinatubonensis]|uniref:ogr/Delta-like zinc finger family protein n=1 Tax=Cupriavidus pinatubonensis TaxID=248026 RepID=UPI00112C9D74|nr:ogr/Delta-like zinc finger family protein [Cupriavidus pinatubonensis]TPQ43129.1 transcriptional regulator [Cupriavidus pinatubonensis]
MRMNCPHCGAIAHIRSSRSVSRMTRELYCQCTNLTCGHTFVGLVEVVRTLSPSSNPDPEIAKQLAARSGVTEEAHLSSGIAQTHEPLASRGAMA